MWSKHRGRGDKISHRNGHTVDEDVLGNDEQAGDQSKTAVTVDGTRSSARNRLLRTFGLILATGFGVVLIGQLTVVNNELVSLRRQTAARQQAEALGVIYSRGQNAAHERVRSNAVKMFLGQSDNGSVKRARIDLGGAPLDGCFLQDLGLERVNFARASLKKADLSRSQLNATVLSEARLSEATLIEMKAPNAKFHDAIMNTANLRSADLRMAEFDGANLSGAILKYARCPQASFRNAVLKGANLQEANLTNANLCGADLQKADLRIANLHRARLVRAVLRGANFEMVNLKEASLHEADVSGANFRGVSGLTKEQIKTALNWQTAIYSNKMATALGLPEAGS